MTSLQVGIFCDYLEEQWPSMDLVAEMLLQRFHTGDVRATRVQPVFHPYLSRPNANRVLNRLIAYPLEARKMEQHFDLFHVIDHSYAQLVHVLPAQRTIVTCHDADTFRCLFSPAQERRPLWFRAMTRHILSGLRKAAYVVCVSEATRSQLLQHGLVDPLRIHVIHNGVSPAYSASPDPQFDVVATRLLGPPTSRTELLHVGSTIPRKRIDLLLRVFAQARAQDRTLHLIRVGAPFSAQQQHLAVSLGLDAHITHLGNIPAQLLASVYRRAAILLVTSDAEGFGFPLAEAMSCGTPVVASDIPALREVGGSAVVHYPVGDITKWSEGLLCLLEERANDANSWYQRTVLCRERASFFCWDRNARELTHLYRTLLTQT